MEEQILQRGVENTVKRVCSNGILQPVLLNDLVETSLEGSTTATAESAERQNQSHEAFKTLEASKNLRRIMRSNKNKQGKRCGNQ